jgi:hypothetical protein
LPLPILIWCWIKFAMLPSGTCKGNPKFSMPSNVRVILITSIEDRETYACEWKAKKTALIGRTTLCSLVCFLLFYCCFDEFNLQFWCGDKMGSKVLALVLAFLLASSICCQKGKVIVFHMSKCEAIIIDNFHYRIFKFSDKLIFILCEVKWNYLATSVSDEDSILWFKFDFCIISKG